MLLNLFYGHGIIFTAALVIGLCLGISLAGQWTVHRLVPFGHRRSHNDVIGYTAATGALIYVVLLAFIASTVWISYDRADSLVSQEASLAGDLFNDASVLPDSFGDPAAKDLRDYVKAVVTEEWPGMDGGNPSAGGGWRLLRGFYEDLSRVEGLAPMHQAIVTEMLTRLNHLYDVRRERVRIASRSSLHPVIWFVILAGGLFTLAFCWLFGFQKGSLHYVSSSMVAATLGLVVFLIVAFNYPFRGPMQIPPKPFENILKYMERRLAPPETNPTDKAPMSR